MKNYFLHDGHQQIGSFTIEELKLKNITKDTNVWTEGMEKWDKAGNITDIKSLFTSTPPPFIEVVKEEKTEQKTPPPLQNTVSSNANNAPENKTVAPVKKKSNAALWISISVFVVLLGCAALYFAYSRGIIGGGSSGDYYQHTMSVEETERLTPSNFLSDQSTYREALLGGKWVVEGSITSSATVITYKNIVLRISFYDSSGNLLGTNDYTVNNRISPNQTIQYKAKLEGFGGTNSIGVSVDRANSE